MSFPHGFDAPKISESKFLKLRDSIIDFFSNFPANRNPSYEKYQKATESFLFLLINHKEQRIDESINRAGQFIEQSFQIILDLMNIIPEHPNSPYVTNNDQYRALKRNLLGRPALFYNIISLLRCVYKVRSRIEHHLIKVGQKCIFLIFLTIYQFLLEIKLNEIYSGNQGDDIGKHWNEIREFLLSTNAIANVTGIFLQPYIGEFLNILKLQDEEIDNQFNSVTIPIADLKEMEKVLNFILEILADPKTSQAIFIQNILPFDVINTYPGAREIFPYEEISAFLIQNLKNVAEEQSKDAFKFGGPSLEDLDHQSYVYFPKICNTILADLNEHKRVQVSGNSGLGKTTLAKIIGYFFSKAISEIDFSSTYDKIPTDFPNPVYFFDFFSQEHEKIEKGFRTLKQLSIYPSRKYDINRILLIIDNVQLMTAKERVLVDFLSDHFKVMLIIKTEETAPKNRVELEDKEQVQEKPMTFEEVEFDLNKNKEYLEEIISGILLNSNPNIDPRSFIDPLTHVQDFPSTSQGDIEKNLWTIAFLARILHRAYLDNESALSFNQILTDFQRFNIEIREFIELRFQQFLKHMLENKVTFLPSEERHARDHLEIVLILVALMSQIEIPLEKEFLKKIAGINESRFSLLSSRLKHIDFNYETAIKIVEFLKIKGELIQKEDFNKELEYFLPHQKLSLILKNALLYPLNPREIAEFQAEFFAFYLENGKYFGELMKFLEKFAIRGPSQRIDLSKLYPENNLSTRQRTGYKFYLHKLIERIDPDKIANQLSSGFLNQIIRGMIVLANLYDEELKGFLGYETNQIEIPDPYKNTIRKYFGAISPNSDFFEKIVPGLFKRSLESRKNFITFEDLDHLHYLWFYYTKHPDEQWELLLKYNLPTIISLIAECDQIYFLMNVKSEYTPLKQDTQSPKRFFYRSFFAEYGKQILKAFEGADFLDYDLLIAIFQLSGYEEIFSKIIEQHFKNELHNSPLSRTLEQLDVISKKFGKNSNLQKLVERLHPSLDELNQILLEKLKNGNLLDLVLFFDISLNTGDGNPQLMQIFDKFFTLNFDSILDLIKEHTALEIFQTFYREMALNFNDVIKDRGPFLLKIFRDPKWLVEKINWEKFDDVENSRTFCILLEHFNSILHFQSDIDLHNTISKILNDSLGAYEHFTNFSEIRNLLNWRDPFPIQTLHVRRLFAQIFFQKHLTNITSLLVQLGVNSLSRFFQIFETSLNHHNSPNEDESNKKIFSIWTSNDQKERMLRDVLIPLTIREIKKGWFDCVEYLSFSSTLFEFLPQIRKTLEENSLYNILDYAFDMSKEGLSHDTYRVDETIPYYIQNIHCPEFERHLLQILKRFKKMDHQHPNPEIAPKLQDYLNNFREKIHQLIEDWYKQFTSNGKALELGSPRRFIEFFILLLKYNKEIGMILLENNSAILSTLRENPAKFITYSWLLLSLIQSKTPAISVPSLRSRLTEIWEEQISTMNPVQFELFCMVTHTAYLRGFSEQDYSLDLKNQYFPKAIFNSNSDIKALITSIKIYEGGLSFGSDVNPIDREQYIKTSFLHDQFLLPPVQTYAAINNEQFINYHTSFRNYLDRRTISVISSRLRHFYGPADLTEYCQRELSRLYQFLYNYVTSKNQRWDTFDGEFSDLPTFHSYLCYVKLALSCKMANLYPRKDNTDESPDLYLQVLYRGDIPRFIEDIGKSPEQLKESKSAYDTILKEVSLILKPFENCVQMLLSNEELISSLFSDTLNFGDLVLFAGDFHGLYFNILKGILGSFDKYFGETPSVFDNVEDQTPYALFTYLFFLYQYLGPPDPQDFSLIFGKYKRKLVDLMTAAGPTSIQGLLFRGFPLAFVQLLLEELDSIIIALLEQDYPFWNLGMFFGRGDASINYFLDRYESELREVCEKPRIDSLVLYIIGN